MQLQNEFSREMVLAKDEIVKNEILKQAQLLFKQFGLKKTTMDEIAAACGKAKSTLYHYYKSKEEVFDAVIEKELVSLRQIIKERVEQEKKLQAKIICYIINFHEEVMNKMNLYRIVKNELLNQAIAQQHFHRMMKFEQSYITRLIEDGYDSGEFKAVDKEEIPWLSELLLAAFFGIVRYSIESDKGFDQEKLVRAATALVPKIFE